MSKTQKTPVSVQADQADEDAAITCAVAEQVRNGGPLDWQYWANRLEIAPQQAAKLAHCIDPIKWPDDEHAQGPFNDTLRLEIQRKAEWLAERNQGWTLLALVEALGDTAPHAMQQAAWLAQAEALWAKELDEMRRAGRYTLEGAAHLLAQEIGADKGEMLDALTTAVHAKSLFLYAPGKERRYRSTVVRDFYGEACWDDLNDWLADIEPRTTWRFPSPAAQGKAMSPPVSTAASIATHRLNNRSNALAAVIASAINTAVAPSDSHSVWAELVKLAELESKPAPLLGYSSDGIQYRGKKYEENGVPDVFTAKNLRDRMARAKAR